MTRLSAKQTLFKALELIAVLEENLRLATEEIGSLVVDRDHALEYIKYQKESIATLNKANQEIYDDYLVLKEEADALRKANTMLLEENEQLKIAPCMCSGCLIKRLKEQTKSPDELPEKFGEVNHEWTLGMY